MSRIQKPEELGRLVRSKEEPLTFLPAAPFIHGAAQWAALIGWFGGGKVVLSPGRSFDARAGVLRSSSARGVNTITLVGDAMARPLVEALARARSTTCRRSWSSRRRARSSRTP